MDHRIAPDEVLLEDLQREVTDTKEIILYNDDVNTFAHVIRCLVQILGHDPLQAEQCAWIVHNNGKCSVKRGTYEYLEPRCIALQERGLSAVIA